MPNIEKIRTRAGTAHRVRWCANGVRHQEYFPAQIPYHLVKQFSRNVLSEEYQSKISASSSLTLAELARVFAYDRREEVAVWRHAVAMRHMLDFFDPQIPAAEITAQQIHTFRDDLLRQRCESSKSYDQQQASRRGVNNDLRHIRVVFRWAYRKGMIDRHPFDRVDFYKAAAPKPDVLTRAELNAFRLAMDKQDRLIMHFLRFTGLRIGEAINVKCADVDLQNGKIFLDKTKNRDQIDIPIDRRLARIWRWTGALDGPEYVIPYRNETTVIHHFRRAMRAAGIDKKSPTHIFRHSAGRRIMERYWTTGNAQEIARKFLRHKSRTMTDHYAQIFREDIKQAMDDVDL